MTFNSKAAVDSRVVELKFENQQFEKNAKASMSTLDRLKAALDFSKTKDTFSNIGSGLKSISIAPVTAGVQQLTTSFSALDVMATRALMNITDSIQSTMTNFVKSVTIDQVGAGWDKYAEKTSAVQTIMAATAKDWDDTGAQMEYVNGQLEKLNWFTDETSYNFLDMVNNIGKFTSNNIGLAESVTAMEGISNWAAISGANVNEASRAMYNLSQAMATGTVKLIDWKSIENANMATAEFKQTAIETAESLGTLKKVGDAEWETLDGKAKVSVTNFNEGLQKGWFTSDVLMKTLNRYGAFTDKLSESLDQMNEDVTTSEVIDYIEQFKDGSIDLEAAADATGLSVDGLRNILTELSSEEMEFGLKAFKAAQEAKTFGEAIDSVKDAVSTGWMNTFELMFGDYEKAKTLWTTLANDLYDIFAEGGNARNKLIKDALNTQENLDLSDWKELEHSGVASPEYMKALRAAISAHNDFSMGAVSDATWLNKAFESNVVSVKDLRDAYESLFGFEDKVVNEGMKASVETTKETDKEFAALLDTLDKYGEEDIRNVLFGDHAYAEGQEELEKTIDSLMSTLGLTQEQGDQFVEVLKDIGYFGGLSTESLAKLSDEQLKNKGYTEDQIQKLRGATKEGEKYLETIDKVSKKRPTGGELWTDTLNIGMQSLVDIFGIAQEAWNNVFDGMDSGELYNIITNIHDAVEGFSEWVNESETLQNIFTGIFSFLEIIVTTVEDLAGGALTILSAVLEGLGINVEDVANNVSNAVTSFNDWYSSSHPIAAAMRTIAAVAGMAARAVRALYDWFMKIPFVRNTINNFKVGFKEAFASLPEFFDGLTGKFDEFSKKLEEMGGFKFENIGAIFQLFKDTILSYITDFDGFEPLKNAFIALKNDAINLVTEMAAGVWEKLQKLREDLDGTFAGGILGGLLDAIKGVYDAITGANKTEGEEAAEGSVDILSRVGLAFSNFFGLLANVPWFAVGGALGGLFIVKKIFNIVTGFGKIRKFIKKGVKAISETMEGISEAVGGVSKNMKANRIKNYAIAIGILTACVFALAQLSVEQIVKGVIAVAALGGLLLGLSWLMDKMNKDKGLLSGLRGGPRGLLSIALAIGIMTLILEKLMKLDYTNLGPALLVLTLLTGIVLGIYFLMGKIAKANGGAATKGGFTLLLFAFALKLMVGIVEQLSKLSTEELVKGIAATGLLAAILVAVNGLMGKFKGGGFWNAVGLVAVVLAIKLMVGIVEELSKLSIEELARGIIATGLLGLILAAINGLMGKFKGGGVLKGLGAILIVVAIRLLVGAVQELSKLTIEELARGVVAVGLLGLIVAGISILMGKFKGAGVFKGVGAILIVVAIRILTAAVTELSKLSIEELQRSLVAVALLGAILTAVSLLIGKFGGAGVLKGIGSIGIAAAIYIMVQATKELAQLDPDAMNRALVAIGVLSLCLSAIQFVASKCRTGLMSVVTLIAIAGSLWILADAMGKLAKYKPARLKSAMLAMTVLAGLIAALLIVANFTTSDLGDLGSIGSIAGAVGGLATALGVLADKDPEKLKAAAIALSMITGVFAILMVVTKYAGKVSLKIFLLVAVIGLLALIIGLLANFTDPDSALKTAEALTMVMLSLSVLMGVLALVGLAGPAVMGGLAALGILVGAFAILSGVFAAIEHFTGGGFGKALQKGIDIMVEIGRGIGRFFGAIVGGFATEATADLPAIADAIVGFMDKMQELGDMENLDWSKLLDALGAITAVSFTELLTAVPNMISELVNGKSAVEQFAEDLEVLAGGLVSWQTQMDTIGGITVPSEEINALTGHIKEVGWAELGMSVSTMLTRLFRWTDKTAMQQFTEDITELASGLVSWQTQMDTIAGVTVPEAELNALTTSVKNVSWAELGMGISTMLTRLFRWTTKSSMEQFSEDIAELATGLGTWQSHIETIGAVTVPEAELNALTASVKNVGWTELGMGISTMLTRLFKWTSQSSMEQFTTDITELATGLTEWQAQMDTIAGITIPSDGISTLCGEITKVSMTELFTSISDFASKILTGKTSMQKFKDETNLLATALIKWRDKMEGLGEIKVPQQAITDLAEAIKSVPNTGIWEAIDTFFTGTTDVEDFADALGDLGTGLSAFDANIGNDFNPKKVKKAAKLLNTIASLGKDLETVGGWTENQWNSVGGGFGYLAESLNHLFEQFTVDDSKLSAVGNMTGGLSQMLQMISGTTVDGGSGTITDTGAIDKFIDNLTRLKDLLSEIAGTDYSGLSGFTDAVGKLAQTDISAATDAASKEGSDAMGTSGTQMGESLASSMGKETGAMKDAMGSLTSAAASAADAASSTFVGKGRELVAHFASGVYAGVSALTTAVSAVASQASGITLPVGDLYMLGRNFVDGFANGISAFTFIATNAARAMTRQAIDASRNEAAINSPSKETYKIGAGFVEGFVLAIHKLGHQASDSTRSMTRTAISEMRGAIRGISDIIAGDIDGDPVIRPVLDLSGVQEGASSISSLLSAAQPLGINANIDAIHANSVMLRRAATADDIVEALSSIRGGGDTYNYNVGGVTYDDGSNITDAVRTLVRAVRVGGRA